jgi:hypothetical protein
MPPKKAVLAANTKPTVIFTLRIRFIGASKKYRVPHYGEQKLRNQL